MDRATSRLDIFQILEMKAHCILNVVYEVFLVQHLKPPCAYTVERYLCNFLLSSDSNTLAASNHCIDLLILVILAYNTLGMFFNCSWYKLSCY